MRPLGADNQGERRVNQGENGLVVSGRREGVTRITGSITSASPSRASSMPRWRLVGESFMALAEGLQNVLWALGGVPLGQVVEWRRPGV